MATRVLAVWLVLGAFGLALAGEAPVAPAPPGEQPGPRDPDREARRRDEMMRRHRMMIPGVPPQIIQFWQENDPEGIEELRHHLAAHPHQRGEIVRRLAEETRKLAETRRKDPEAFELVIQQRRLDRHVRKLGGQLREAKEQPDNERTAGELRATLDQLFEVREVLREREIKGLEKRIEELREFAKKRRAHKAEIIDRRIKELSGELDYLKW